MTTNNVINNNQKFNKFNNVALTAKEQHRVKGGTDDAAAVKEFIVIEDQVEV